MNTSEFYDRISNDYTALLERTVPCYKEMMVNLLSHIPDKLQPNRILELGCGTGNLTEMLIVKYPLANIEAVDFSSKIIDECRTRLNYTDQIHYTCADFKDLNVKSSSFDLIISSISIHHLLDEDKAALFAKLNAALKPGGVFIYADQCRAETDEVYQKHQNEWKKEAFEHGAKAEDWETWMTHQEMHDHHSTISQQVHWLNEASFIKVDVLWKYLLWTVLYAEK